MHESQPEMEPLNLNEAPGEVRCYRYADGSSVCVEKDKIVLVEAKSPYLAQPCTPDSRPEKPTL